MLKRKEEKVLSTVHLNRSQLQQVDRLARQTKQSRAHVLREIIDVGLVVLNPGRKIEEEYRQKAVERLLKMGDGYGESRKTSIGRLDDELYGGS